MVHFHHEGVWPQVGGRGVILWPGILIIVPLSRQSTHSSDHINDRTELHPRCMISL